MIQKTLKSVAAFAFLASMASAAPFDFSYTGPPLAFDPPDNLAVPIVVTDSGEITDLNVEVNLTSAFVEEIGISLEHVETGTTVELRPQEVGQNQTNMVGTIFDDEATDPITSGSGPYTGSFQPVAGSLSDFDGESLTGTWNLLLSENNVNDNATFESFRIFGQAIVPEPASVAIWSLLGLGLAAFGYFRFRRTKA